MAGIIAREIVGKKNVASSQQQHAGGTQLQLLFAFKFAVLQQCSNERLASPDRVSSIYTYESCTVATGVCHNITAKLTDGLRFHVQALDGLRRGASVAVDVHTSIPI
jgi:hypothetical protein